MSAASAWPPAALPPNGRGERFAWRSLTAPAPHPAAAGDRSNWDLSAERANATRRLLTDAGLPEARIRSVAGHADRDPLLPSDPLAAANRRIAVLVLRDRPAAGGR